MTLIKVLEVIGSLRGRPCSMARHVIIDDIMWMDLKPELEKVYEKAGEYDRLQQVLTEYADLQNRGGVYPCRNLPQLPERYAETLKSYLDEVLIGFKLRDEVTHFELRYEKARGDQFNAELRGDKLEALLTEHGIVIPEALTQ